MGVFHEYLKKAAETNLDYRRVLFTGPHTQLVAMCLQPGEEIGEERHQSDQVLYFVGGEGEATVDGEVIQVRKHDIVVVPHGTEHNLRNTGKKPLKLFTTYAPPQHADGTVHRTKADAEAAEREARRPSLV